MRPALGGSDKADAEHIAGMDPEVAKAVGAWLIEVAALWDRVGGRPGPRRDDAALHVNHAEHVARAYLRENGESDG